MGGLNIRTFKMISIPAKLQQPGIRFVLVAKRGKKPFQLGWQKKNIAFNDPELINHLRDDGNYGIIGGNGLMLLDFDNKEVQEKALPLLPETFTVMTGSGMLHLYYKSNGEDSFKGFDSELNTIFDVQGNGKQVIGPGSVHPNGNYYEVVKDVPIAFIEYEELKSKLMQFDNKPKKDSVSKKENKEYVKISNNDFLDTLKEKVDMSEALEYCGVNTDSNPTSCPFHESKGGQCLGFNNETAHCFHCENSWNVFSLIKEYKKCDFKEALDIVAGMAGMKDELLESKKKYIEDMKKKEVEVLDRKIAEEKTKIKDKTSIIQIPGYTRIVKTIDGKEQDPIKDKIMNKVFRSKSTRGTTLGDENIKIKIPEGEQENENAKD